MHIGSQNSLYIWEEQGTKLHAKPSASASCPSTASQSTHMVDSNACPTTDKADSLLCSTFMWLPLSWESLSQGNSGKEILYPEFVIRSWGQRKTFSSSYGSDQNTIKASEASTDGAAFAFITASF